MFSRPLAITRKYKHHFTFILSVIVSLILIYNSESSHFSVFRSTITDFATIIKKPLTSIKLSFDALKDNEQLREQLMLSSLENEALLEYQAENVYLKEMLDFKRKSIIKITPAKVVNMGLTANLLSITIDIGAESGIKKNAPILTPSGIIGKVATVNNRSSVVQLISDPDFRIGVRFFPSGATGILRWKRNNICDVKEVYKNSSISVGDRAVSSGLSDIFPAGLPVGIVTNVADDRSEFQKIVSVRIEENLSSLSYIFAVINEEQSQ